MRIEFQTVDWVTQREVTFPDRPGESTRYEVVEAVILARGEDGEETVTFILR